MRDLCDTQHGGGGDALGAFEELQRLLLNLTVLDPSSFVRLTYGDVPGKAALGGPAGPKDAVLLGGGSFLRISVSVFLDDTDERGPLLKVSHSSHQYQLDARGDRWVFRYDYLREPGVDPHPRAHFQVNGHLREPEALPDDLPLNRVHFAVGRVSIEAIIRVLVEQFKVPTREPAAVWRPVLAESEQRFLEVARIPTSGPPE